MTQNQPLCMAWFPEGQFLNNTSFSGSLISTVKATQYNPTSNSLSVAGSFATSDPVSAFNYISYGVTTPIPTSANSNTGTFYQNGSDFIVENLPVGCNNMVLQFTSSAYGPASLSTVVPYNKSCNSNNIYR